MRREARGACGMRCAAYGMRLKACGKEDTINKRKDKTYGEISV